MDAEPPRTTILSPSLSPSPVAVEPSRRSASVPESAIGAGAEPVTPTEPGIGADGLAERWMLEVWLTAQARWVRTVLVIRSGERAALDELWQELSLAVFRRPPVHLAVEKRAAWLYGTAVRIALLYRRQQGRRRRRLEKWSGQQPRDGFAPVLDPLDWLLADERQRLVRQALRRLTPKDRELLVLKYTEDWSYAEIATHLGLSLVSVTARLHRARQRLRSELIDLAPLESVSQVRG